jgi:hypothetical protein
MLKQFRILDGWNTRFLNAKFLKAVHEKENLVNKHVRELLNKAKNLHKNVKIKYILLHLI